MKLISLNLWGGKLYEPLMDFLKKESADTDIFCFQEVYNGKENLKNEEGRVMNLFSEISNRLEAFKGFHHESFSHTHKGSRVPYGLAFFIKNSVKIEVVGSEELFVSPDELGLEEKIDLYQRLLSYVKLNIAGGSFLVCNLHGIWTGGDKDDLPARLQQSRKVREFMSKHQGPQILVGDFNLNPETESLKILEQGMKNLIHDYKITTTRSPHYRNFGQMKFADYCLVSPDVKVKTFEVPQVEISDHLPLVLEFEV